MRKKTFTILHQEEVTGLSSSLCTSGLQSNVSSIQQNLQHIEDSQSWSDLSKLLTCERVQVISHDGVSIPLLILYSREAHIHGESPGILFGYGAYGEDLDKSWCSDRLSLIARGWVLAFADVRYSLTPAVFFSLQNCTSHHLSVFLTRLINLLQHMKFYLFIL
jgi:prolyl oligopeptidase PreP (S9A serine peptidase family)